MFGTPDFGQSDLWHFNFPVKFFLSEALKQGYLPLWSKDIGMGFPIFGEGQIGVFYPFNLLLFRLFDAVTAFNLSYLIIFLTTFIGSFLFGRVIKLAKIPSLFLALIFTFSGVMITQIPHINLIQIVSWLPWQFYFAESFIQSKKKRFLFGITLVTSLQILAGYPQIVFISLFASSIFFLLRAKQEKQIRLTATYLLFVALAVVLCLPQLVPSIELVKQSFRSSGTTVNDLVLFPFNPQNFLSFLNPYWFGNPRMGTYPPFSVSWGIFWESTGYIGIIPLFLAAIAWFNKHHRRNVTILTSLLLVSAVLLLGKYTPFFFIFQIPPFSYFRVPARFLIVFVWVLCILAAIGLSRFKSKLVILLLVGVSTISLTSFSLSYNSRIDPAKWLAPPESVSILAKDLTWYRVYCPRPGIKWNNLFLKNGWQNMDDYLPFRNCLDSNQNLLWDIPVIDVRSGLSTRRLDLWQNIVSRAIVENSNEASVKISTPGARLLSQAGVKYFITPYSLISPETNFEPVATTSSEPRFTIYQNGDVKPHAYLTNNYKVVSRLDDLVGQMASFSGSTVITEDSFNFAPGDYSAPATVTKNSNLEVIIQASVSTPSLLILSDTYYPGWYAEIDGLSTKIYPVNLAHRAVVLQPGKHQVIFRYQPLKLF